MIGVDPAMADQAVEILEAAGEKAYKIGEAKAGEKGVILC